MSDYTLTVPEAVYSRARQIAEETSQKVDEVLLGDGNTALQIMDRFLPAEWQTALGYIGLMLCLARSIPAASAATRAGEWPRLSGFALEGKTVGLLGLGSIGKEVARRLCGFACRLVAHDPAPDAAFAAEHGVTLLPLAEVTSQADFLSLHLPVLPDTHGLVNAALLVQMKRGAFLINTSRGELIDEAALFEALQSGHLRGAALDAFAAEPPGAGHPLLTLPQVIATPHMGAHADSAANAMGWGALKDCLAVLSGEQPLNRVI